MALGDGESTVITLVTDVSNGGHLRRSANKDEVDKATKTIIAFTQGGQLRAVDSTGKLEQFVVDLHLDLAGDRLQRQRQFLIPTGRQQGRG